MASKVKLQIKLELIKFMINQLCEDYACKINFWKTPYGQKILEIKGILNEVESE